MEINNIKNDIKGKKEKRKNVVIPVSKPGRTRALHGKGIAVGRREGGEVGRMEGQI